MMSDKAVDYLEKSKGWEIGVGPTVGTVKRVWPKNLSSSILKDDTLVPIV